MLGSRKGNYRRITEEMIAGHYDAPTKLLRGKKGDALGDALIKLGTSIEKRVEDLNRLLEVSERIHSGVSLADVMDHVYDTFKTTIPYERLAIALVDNDDLHVEIVWMRDETSNRGSGVGVGYRKALTKTSLSTILEHGRPRILNDLPAYLRKNPQSEPTRQLVAEGMRSSLTCPLFALNRVVGFLFFSSTTANAYDEAHVHFFTQIAKQVALSVEKSRLYEDLIRTKRNLEHANDKLAELANVDGLTRLANRRYFDEQLDREWRRSLRAETPLSIVLIDVDYFKQYNDSYGHLQGDECLRTVARTISDSAKRATDLIARYGGEEFVILLATTTPDQANEVAEVIRRRIEQLTLPHSGSPHQRITVSIGLSGMAGCSNDHDTIPTPAGLLGAADGALYQAKLDGRNCTRRAEPGSWAPFGKPFRDHPAASHDTTC